MAHESAINNPSDVSRQNWTKLRDQKIARATYCPAVVAIGIVCLLWGLVTTLLISLLGSVLLSAGLAVWIGELRHENE